jgi:hypothetical protein
VQIRFFALIDDWKGGGTEEGGGRRKGESGGPNERIRIIRGVSLSIIYQFKDPTSKIR